MKGSVKKNLNTKKWDLVFDAGNDPLSGKRRQIKRRGFLTRQEALDAMTLLKSEFLQDEFTDLSNLSLELFMEEWFIERKIHLQASTYETHHIYFRTVIKPRLGHFKLQKISPMIVQNFINELVQAGHYSEYTIHLIFRILSSAMKKATAIKLIRDNPTIGITLPKINRKEINVWSGEKINHFIAASKQTKRLTRCFTGFLIGFFCGCREGEILGLRFKDIDFDNRVLYIRQTLAQKAEIKSGAKNRSSIRSISIPENLIPELIKHREMIMGEKLLLGDKYHDHNLVICTQNGKPIIPRNFRKEFYNLTEKVGLPKTKFHSATRHSHATLLIQQNVNVKLISERLGHAKIGTTLDIYSHVTSNMQKSVAVEIDKVLNL
ncbi:tyrosine-type recombinase/integrase [Peribacillus frigoritolerans]|uniref:tyrosine-type recombinase/integrase n=1 Tax=Peribacillus frigoritolerans TaxID=450367 RepID=UPI002E23ECEF|nr:tyrosine-type recombinase/integrase [Peribacillus frigoritolerans]MED4693808.1 tyrosine-type recombinase/integrase [Peribacillus frigoritolerans]